MTNPLQYAGRADGWTLAEYKSLLDELASWHDPGNNREVTSLDWNVSQNRVYVSMEVEGVTVGDISTEQSSITTALGNAPNTWPTDDSAFRWG